MPFLSSVSSYFYCLRLFGRWFFAHFKLIPLLMIPQKWLFRKRIFVTVLCSISHWRNVSSLLEDNNWIPNPFLIEFHNPFSFVSLWSEDLDLNYSFHCHLYFCVSVAFFVSFTIIILLFRLSCCSDCHFEIEFKPAWIWSWLYHLLSCPLLMYFLEKLLCEHFVCRRIHFMVYKYFKIFYFSIISVIKIPFINNFTYKCLKSVSLDVSVQSSFLFLVCWGVKTKIIHKKA